MSGGRRKRLIFSAFTENKHGGYWAGLWRHKWGWTLDANDLDDWIAYVKLLEKGKFDFLFLADVLGVYDVYGGSMDGALRHGISIPVNDPAVLMSALAAATKDLGLVFTSAPMQSPPYDFARKLSTLDHLSKGRIGWNIVTGFTHSGARNFGAERQHDHADRYRLAGEYVDVLYRLWEGSWEDDAFVRNTGQGVFVNPAKVHPIDFSGAFFKVAGPHQTSPSPQRTPFLCQAGASEAGRAFAARHAEAVFLPTPSQASTKARIDDIRRRAQVDYGRKASDIVFLKGAWFVIGGTEAEARRKHADILEKADIEALLVDTSGKSGIDFSQIDLDADLADIKTDGIQGILQSFLSDNPGRNYKFRDYARYKLTRVFVGTPDQIADQLEEWSDTGLDGFLVFGLPSTEAIKDFVEGLCPTLQEHGLMQTHYAEGTLREKIFGLDRYLPDTHPARDYRRR